VANGRNAAFCGILQRILEEKKDPVSIDELMVHALDRWGRGFPQTPYEPAALVYKMLHLHMDIEENYDDLGAPPVVPLEKEGAEPIPLQPDLSPALLNRVAQQIKRIRVTLKGRTS